jgi:hypothetical protein
VTGKIDELDALGEVTRTDPTRLPELVAEARRLMHDSDGEVRAAAAAAAFYAVRQMFPSMLPAERVALCEAVSVDLEAAIAAGLVGDRAMLGNVLRGVVQRIRDGAGALE